MRTLHRRSCDVRDLQEFALNRFVGECLLQCRSRLLRYSKDGVRPRRLLLKVLKTEKLFSAGVLL